MSKSFRALIVWAAFFASWPLASVQAQDGRRMGEGPLPYPGGVEVAFEWRYSCPSGKGCSFSCPGSGGGSNVTRLSIHLGNIPVGHTEHAAGVFYEFSTIQIPRGNGFALTTGISTLSCQVQGMDLDYSGPADTPSGSIANSK